MNWKIITKISKILLVILFVIAVLFWHPLQLNDVTARIWLYSVLFLIWLLILSAIKNQVPKSAVGRYIGFFLLVLIPIIILFCELVYFLSYKYLIPVDYGIRMRRGEDKCVVLEEFAADYLFKNQPASCIGFERLISKWGSSCPSAHQLYAAAGNRCDNQEYLKKAISIEDRKFYRTMLGKIDSKNKE